MTQADKLVRFDELSTDWGPAYDTELAELSAMFDTLTRQSAVTGGQGRALRQAHAKTYGLVQAEVTVLDGLPAEYAQGIYATPATYPALIRFSNGLPHIRPDIQLGNACGVGLKLFGVPGPSLLDDEPDTGTVDFNLINNSTFFCNTVHDYLIIAPLFDALPAPLVDRDSRHAYLESFLTRAGTLAPADWLWDELLSFLSFANIPPRNLLLQSYWSMGAVRHGDYVAKIRLAPTAASAASVEFRDVDRFAEAEPIRRTLVAELDAREHHFELQVQLCRDLAAMPVENTSIDWPERLSPFVTVATVTIPAQDVSGDDNLAAAEPLSFTPWRTRDEHRPLGQIQTVRRDIYKLVSTIRHEVNRATRHEPSTPGDVLPKAL